MSLKIVNLKASINEFRIGPIDFEIETGHVVSILGPSGSGKTLLLKSISGLHPIESGEIWLDGINITELPPYKRKIAFVFQNDVLFPHMKTSENLGFPLRITGKPKKIVGIMVKKKAEELDGLPHYLSKMPSELPKGMKKLAAIGRETIRSFKLILMDEPLEHLDRKVREEMRVFLKRIIRSIKVTTIVVLNDPLDAMALTDETVLLMNGKIISFGKPMDLYTNPKDEVTLRYFSPNGLNEVMTYVKDKVESIFGLNVNLDNGIYNLMVRPEDFEVSYDGRKVKVMDEIFLNSKKKLLEFELDKIRMRAIVEKTIDENVKLKPRKAFFIKDGEIKVIYED